MRVHASGVGDTSAEALVKVYNELKTAAVNEEDIPRGMSAEQKALAGRISNPNEAVLSNMISQLAGLVEPIQGYKVRVLVSCENKGVGAHARLEVDLIRL